MIKLPTLYARSNTKAVLTWTIIVEGNQYYTESGQIDGALTRSKPTTCKPKNVGRANETTAEQQALSEAEAKHAKKLKTGYFLDINRIDDFYFVEPMLAEPLHKVRKGVKFPCLLQCKYNGGRCLATREGLFTRKGEKYHLPFLQEGLKPIFVKHPNAVLDGELFNNDFREQLNEIMKLLRKTVHATAEDLRRAEKLIRFYVYDGYGFDGLNEEDNYSIRLEGVNNIIDEHPRFLRKVETWQISNEGELWDRYGKLIEDRQEGGIVRYSDNTYEHKRTQCLIKLKPTDDAEFKVLSVEEGDGNWSGAAKTFLLQRIDGGKYLDGTDTFSATLKGSYEEGVALLQNPKRVLGKVVKIFYNGLTGKGKPNYAQLDINNAVNEKARTPDEVFV